MGTNSDANACCETIIATTNFVNAGGLALTTAWGRQLTYPTVSSPTLIPPYGSFDRTSVPAAESIPPIPFTSEILALGTWRAPHSPRSWRVASIMGKMPYIPECVYDNPPPFVLIGNVPPGVDFPSAKKYTPSPGLQKPRDSSMIGGPDVKAS